MADFYIHLQETTTDKEMSGKHGLKANQFEDSIEFEQKFLDFVKSR